MIRTCFWAAVLLLTPAVLFAAGILAWWSLTFRPPNCEQREPLSQVASPDGAWVATLYDNICSDGGWVTVLFVTAEITRPNEPAAPMPAKDNTVFGMDRNWPGVPEPLTLTWTAPRSLEITLPNDARTATQKQALGDIAISYKYVPDDPVERTCLKKWYSLPFDEHRRYDRKDFVATCRAEGEPHLAK
jgi:hypothetical protein